MEPITVGDAVAAMSGVLVAGEAKSAIGSLSTDTRTLREGDFFLALKGRRYDGHDFLASAVRRGCAGVIFSRGIAESDRRGWESRGVVLIRVGDSLRGLQDLACWYRGRFRATVIGVTGSNGKTTTKEMIASAARKRFSVLFNEGTINNQIGVPLTLLRLEKGHGVAVLELGMNARGEIRRLAEIADPDIGVITNVGPAHLEFLGSLENVAAAKAELLEMIAARRGKDGGLAVLNADDPYVAAMAGRFPLRARTFGVEKAADVTAEDVSCSERGVSMVMNFRLSGRRAPVSIPALGTHNVRNALAAAATCEALGVEPGEIASGLGEVRLPPMRMEVVRSRGITIVNDAYNANPASTLAAIETLEMIKPSGRRIFVMGDMLELGDASVREHEMIGRRVATGCVEIFVTVGNLSSRAAEAAREAGMEKEAVLSFTDVPEAGAALRGMAKRGDLVLLKASRRVGLEKIAKELEG